MADSGQPKAPSKAGENTLGLLGAVAGLAGNLIFGPDSIGMDFGAPFKAGAAMLRDKREQQSLIELLKSNPHTAPIADMGPSLIQAGGLVNNPDAVNHPEVQKYISQFTGASGVATPPASSAGVLPGEANGQPAPNLLSALQSSAASPATVSTSPDYTSDAFLQKAAALRPDIAEKIITARATKEPTNQAKELLQTILLGKQISGYETPEERRAAQLADRQTMMEQTDKLIQSRQETNQIRQIELQKQQKREMWTPKEDENYNTLNNSIDMGRALLGKIQSGASPSLFTAALGSTDIGQGMLERLSPDSAATLQQIQTLRDLTGKVMGDVKAQSGAQYSAKELQWMQSALPSKWDTPQQLQYSLASDLLKKQWLNYNTIASKVEKAGNLNPAQERGISPEQLRAFIALKKQLGSKTAPNAQSIFENKKNLPYLQALGMDYLIK